MPPSGPPRSSALLLVTVLTVLLGVALSGCAATFGAHLAGPGMPHRMGHGSSTCATTPPTTDATVDVVLMDMGRHAGSGTPLSHRMAGGMAGHMTGQMTGHRVRTRHERMMLVARPLRVSAGQVTFVALNRGSRTHELVVLPLGVRTSVGRRPVTSDRAVDESSALGEASRSCGAGEGDGIAPGSTGWTTLTLTPGRYELVCNRPGHYARGMYAELVVVP